MFHPVYTYNVDLLVKTQPKFGIHKTGLGDIHQLGCVDFAYDTLSVNVEFGGQNWPNIK